MQLAELHKVLLFFSHIDEAEKYFEKNLKDIRQFFYKYSIDELKKSEYNIENLFYDFIDSDAFNAIKSTTRKSPPFTEAFLTILASIFEKLQLRGLITTILNYIPQNSVYYRLQAYLLYTGFTNAKIEYVEKLSDILDLYSKAEFDNGQEYTNEIIKELIKFYRTATEYLSNRDYNQELNSFKSLIQSEELKEKYSFLQHPLFFSGIAGFEVIEITFNEGAEKIYEPSYYLSDVFTNKIISPVKNHPDTEWSEILMGYERQYIRRNILEFGITDFRQPFNNLSTDDKVLLYCYLNMRKHFFTAYYIYDQLENFINYFNNVNPLFIDIGCGPSTSLLALADFYKTKTNTNLTIKYIGIDIADRMIDKAKDFNNIDLYSDFCEFNYYKTWNEINFKQIINKNNIILINASYLFASKSLDEFNLADFINKITVLFKQLPIYFIFQNTESIESNVKYNNFKECLKGLKVVFSKTVTVYYNTHHNSTYEPKSEIVYYEILSNIY